jgi:hypothetical protein
MQQSYIGVCCEGKDLEAADSERSTCSRTSFFAMKAVPGKWESLFVWTMSWFFSFWTLVCHHVLPETAGLTMHAGTK